MYFLHAPILISLKHFNSVLSGTNSIFSLNEDLESSEIGVLSDFIDNGIIFEGFIILHLEKLI